MRGCFGCFGHVGHVGCLLLLLVAAAPAMEPPPPITIRADSPWIDRVGYTPLILDIRTSAACELAIDASSRNGTAASTHIVLAEPGRHRRTLLIPGHQQPYGRNVRITWRSSLGTGDTINCTGQIDELGETILTAGCSTALLGQLESAGFPDDNSSSTPRRASIEADLLPRRWQAYPIGGALVLGPELRPRLEPSLVAALQGWQRAGGIVRVVDGPWPELPDIPALQVETSAIRDFLRRADELRSQPQFRSSSQPHPVPGIGSTALGLFMVLVVVFFILAGPLNLIWAHRRKQLHLLFVSTPLLSGAACLILIVTGLISEGSDIRRSRISLTDVDFQRHQAVDWEGLSYYAPFGPGALTIPDSAQALVLGEDTFRHAHGSIFTRDRQQLNLGIDWQQGQRLLAGWIPAREHRQLVITNLRSERRRLLLRDDWVENGLGVAIRELQWRDADGRLHVVHDLQPGARGRLRRGSLRQTPDLDERLSPSASLRLSDRLAQPYGFVAVLADSLEPPPGPDAIDNEEPVLLLSGELRDEEP